MMQYRAEIDGLRAVAVIPVILFHGGIQLFSGGYVGVDVFFVISGYLITTIILTELAAGQFSIVKFYERRARRILPALFFVLAVCLPCAWFFLLPNDVVSFSKSLMSISTFISNIFFWSERGYFGTATELKPLIHTWSLAIEEQYYLFFPILLIGFVNKRRYFLFLTLVMMGVVSLGLSIWLTSIHVDSAFYLLPTRFWELLIGSFVALQGFYFSQANNKHFTQQILGILGFVLILYSMLFFDSHTVFPGYAALIPTVGTALIIRYVTGDSFIGGFLSHRILVRVGLISYSAYLWHQPIFAFARQTASADLGSSIFIILAAAAMAIAFFSWKYVEQPFRNRASWSRKNIFVFSFVGLVVFFAIGVAGWKTNGFIFRYSAQDQVLLSSFINAGGYTEFRFDHLKLQDFVQDSAKKKILIIGDSYAKDLVNAVAESELSQYIQMSTHQINGECGNLYLHEDLSHKIEAAKRPRCKALGWYQNDRLRRLMEQSDAIWLASAWRPWVAELLPASVENITVEFKKPVLIFGTKNFGKIDQQSILQLTGAQRYMHTEKIDTGYIKVNRFMKTSLPVNQFVDVLSLLCHGETSCRIFTDSDRLISYDGGHLTREGAKYLGEALYKQASLRFFLDR